MPTEIPVSRTKIIIPTLRPEILHRARLLALFDDVLDRKLVIVTAPAGYGKTSLLVDFARQSEMPVCWLSLDALDQDPQRFFIYVIAALEQRFPKFGKQSRGVLRSLVSFEQDSERLLSALVNEIDAQIDQHFTLVVDDYQFVDAVPEIRDLFSRFVYLIGENCHIVLSSRRLPTMPDITLMVAHQQVGGFDLEELAFRPNEIRSLFKKSYGISLDDRTVEDLMRQTEGWITGLQLSASLAAGRLPDLTHTARVAGVDLAVYLDQQVLAPQPPAMRRFLLQSSLLEEFDADLCRAVLGKGDWKSLIKTVQQDNLFVLPVGPGGKWLRYHHLFREFLQQRIQEEEPDKARAILDRLAGVYKERHEWEKAYALYRQLGNPRMLAELVELAGTPMLLNERLITLRNWLEELPVNLLEIRPSLLSLKGALFCAFGEGYSALTCLDQAIAEIQKTEDLPDLALAYVRRSAAYRLVGDYQSSLRDSDEAMRLSTNKPDLRVIYAEAERFKGVSLHNLGQTTEAIQTLENALHDYRDLHEMESVAQTQIDLGITYRASGNYPAARNAYEQALSIWQKNENISSQANVLNSLGVLHHFQGEYETALQTLEAGLERAKSGGPLMQEAFLLTSLGDVYNDLDEFDSANQAYTSAIEIAQQISYHFLTNYLYLVQTRLARRQNQVRKAQYFLDRAKTLIQTGSSNYELGLFHLESGCLELVERKFPEAVRSLRQALDFFINGSLNLEAVSSRIWLTAAHLGSGDVTSARSSLRASLDTSATWPSISPILQVIRQARPWLAGLQEDAEMGPVLCDWLEKVAESEARLPVLRKHLRHLLSTIPIQAPHLTIQAFGKPRVRVNGRLVTSAQWSTTSVRDQFFYILSNAHPLTKEEIGAALWPELDTAHFRLRFKNEFYRMRHALGRDVILFEDNHYRFNRFSDYEYDVEDFTAHINQAKSETRLEVKIAHLRAAFDLKTGPYLQGVDATWAWPERERLNQTYHEALTLYAGLQHQNGDLPAALQACQEILKIEPYREDIHCLAMQIHAERGDRLGVIRQYKECRDALHSELNVDPSSETEALYRKLTA
jgi:LuxR family transcriptional regulator, maltose regulon positive regulatory protein